ncbi:hypothetical protein FKP32DRAFT_1683873 [Trametes sanguinea]|nr:hypothetical protein FKP32DRAFT_1683873 [Trametes sanguinea]
MECLVRPQTPTQPAFICPRGPAALNPICIHPLALPSSSHSSLVSLDDGSLWDCALLQPPSRATSATSSVPPLSSQPAAPRVVSPSCDVQQRLMNLLNFTTEPSSTSPPQEATTSYDPFGPCPSADASTRARTADPHPVSPRGGEHPQSGLGLVLGSACLPILLPRPHLEQDAVSESPSRYSRRLRNIAPAPLQLASSTPRTPLRALTQPQTPATSRSRRTPASSVFVDVPLVTANRPDVFQCNASVSPQSDRRASMTTTTASHSTAPTSPSYRGNQENARLKRSANPTYIDGLSSRQRSSGSRNSPLSPLAPKYGGEVGSSAFGKGWNAPRTPATSSRRIHLDYAVPFTPGLPADAPPPLLRRSEWVPLPDLADAGPPSPDPDVLSPLRADLRLDLGVEDLALRAEKCSETIARASMYLCSCSLLREPESIVDLCEKLRATFASVQRALDGTPSEFHADGSDAKRTWYAKHWQVISSLDRNLNMFYLLAHQVEERPPRIHRLAPTLDKLSTYQAKFADLARRIALSHEKLRFHGLRAQLSTAHAYPVKSIDDARDTTRGRRYDARATRQEARARRREIREELRRVRGRIRAIRERDLDDMDMDVADVDERMTTMNCDDDGDDRMADDEFEFDRRRDLGWLWR